MTNFSPCWLLIEAIHLTIDSFLQSRHMNCDLKHRTVFPNRVRECSARISTLRDGISDHIGAVDGFYPAALILIADDNRDGAGTLSILLILPASTLALSIMAAML